MSYLEYHCAHHTLFEDICDECWKTRYAERNGLTLEEAAVRYKTHRHAKRSTPFEAAAEAYDAVAKWTPKQRREHHMTEREIWAATHAKAHPIYVDGCYGCEALKRNG